MCIPPHMLMLSNLLEYIPPPIQPFTIDTNLIISILLKINFDSTISPHIFHLVTFHRSAYSTEFYNGRYF